MTTTTSAAIDISGLSSSILLKSASLQSSLESKLQQRLEKIGSTLYVETWVRKITPAGLPYLAHTASADPTLGSDFTGWATPTARDWKGPQGRACENKRLKTGELTGNKKKQSLDLPAAALLVEGVEERFPQAHVPEETEDGFYPLAKGVQLNPSHVRWMMGFPKEWDDAAMAAAAAMRRKRKEGNTVMAKTERLLVPEPNIQNSDISKLEADFVALAPGIKSAKLKAGEILYHLRGLTPHGDWERRLKSLCKQVQISRSSAHEYVRAYQKSINESPEKKQRKEPTAEAIVRTLVKSLNSQRTRGAIIAIFENASEDELSNGLPTDIADGADFLDHILYRCKASPYSSEQRECDTCARCMATEKGSSIKERKTCQSVISLV